MRIVTVGDTVNWSGGWGAHAPVPATVVGLEICAPGENEGYDVPSADLDLHHVVVDLDNGHWAYGYQIAPLGTPVGGWGTGILPDGRLVDADGRLR